MSFGQGGPEWGPGGSSTPDWAALAEESERARGRKRRWMIIGGGALATAVIAGIVAVAVVQNSGGSSTSDKPSESLPTPQDLPPSTPGQPSPTFKDEPPPPAPPGDFVSDAKRDKAPLSVATLYPSKKITVNGRPYVRHATATSKHCADAAHDGLIPLLTKHDCHHLYRATYTHSGLAVTVGIAVFDDAATAAKVKRAYEPNLVALPGDSVPDFCRTVSCRTSANSFGRYAYFTIAGRTNGHASTDADKQAVQASVDGSDFAYSRVLDRGRKQAEAAATATAQ
jgi:hypothetical protein